MEKSLVIFVALSGLTCAHYDDFTRKGDILGDFFVGCGLDSIDLRFSSRREESIIFRGKGKVLRIGCVNVPHKGRFLTISGSRKKWENGFSGKGKKRTSFTWVARRKFVRLHKDPNFARRFTFGKVNEKEIELAVGKLEKLVGFFGGLGLGSVSLQFTSCCVEKLVFQKGDEVLEISSVCVPRKGRFLAIRTFRKRPKVLRVKAKEQGDPLPEAVFLL